MKIPEKRLYFCLFLSISRSLLLGMAVHVCYGVLALHLTVMCTIL